MKSLAHFENHPGSIPLMADDVLEFHASRILLLIKLCGTSGRIEGLTKMAKLDFFVRYPQFFSVACEELGKQVPTQKQQVESSMIRFHYGPWDDRYYHLLSYLEAKQLISITASGKRYNLALTNSGKSVAIRFEKDEIFAEIVDHMKHVKKVLGAKSGSALKKLVYMLFDNEVARRTLGEVIRK